MCPKETEEKANAGSSNKVVIIFGATGTGKTRISVELAIRFNGEIINSDKIQVYKGLDVVSNKVTPEEACGIPHHLLGFMDPDADFTAQDFVDHASREVEAIIQRGHLPIIAGGSVSFLRALLLEDSGFHSKYDFCLIWLEVSAPVLRRRLLARVDKMVEGGLVEEAKEFFNPNGDYSRGVRRAIGVPEMDKYYRTEGLDDEASAKLLEASIDLIKENTDELAVQQRENIFNLWRDLGWPTMHRLDATEAFTEEGMEAEEAWGNGVLGPSTKIVNNFLSDNDDMLEAPVEQIATPSKSMEI